MALSKIYSIQPNPHWVLIDNFSKLPDGAAIYTYSSLNPNQFKPAFQDNAGQLPYDQPIVGFANGTMPPIYWEFDPNNPTELYYIRVYDSVNGNFLWDFNNISGAGGSGGSIITASYDIDNLITNGVFYRNCGDVVGSPSLPTFITLAPSNNAGFVATPNSSLGTPAPDIIFAKNNTTASDSISFIDFPLGINTLGGMDTTPVQYIQYSCTLAGAGETYKYIQFPVSSKVQNLSMQPSQVVFYAKNEAGNGTLDLFWRQFYGDGGAPSADQFVRVGPATTLGPDWTRYIISSTVPSAFGKTLGTCGNDGLFLQVRMPLDATTIIDFVKPAVYVGPSAPLDDYSTYDAINSIIDSPRTGDIRTALNDVLLGWINMNDGTIGSASSNATARANVDSFPLFFLIWSLFSSNQALAPMFSSAGAPVAYGGSAVADFNANRQIALTKNLGRVMAGALPVQVSQSFSNTGNVMTVSSAASFNTGVPVTVSGGSLPTPLVAGTTYYAIMLSSTTLSLATSPENAIAGTPIALTTNASGTVTVSAHALGTFLGEEKHTLTIGEMPSHNHTVSITPGSSLGAGALPIVGTTPTTGIVYTSSSTGGGTSHNIIQPTVFMNVFIKL